MPDFISRHIIGGKQVLSTTLFDTFISTSSERTPVKYRDLLLALKAYQCVVFFKLITKLASSSLAPSLAIRSSSARWRMPFTFRNTRMGHGFDLICVDKNIGIFRPARRQVLQFK